MLDNNHIYNSISESNTKSMKELLSEAERGDMGYVKKHDSIATVFRVMSGGKKLQVKLGKTGKKVVIDAKDIDILPESAMNEQPRQLKDKNKEMLVVKDGKVQVIDKKDWKKYQKKGYLVAEDDSVNEASGEFVVFIEKDNGRKKLLHTKKSQRAANMFLTKNVDKILNTSGIRSVGSMSKDQWEKTEARFAENVKKSGMRTVTRKEWDRTHKDFKGMIKGQPHMMYLDKKTNVTKYGPVQIKESLSEGRISKTFKFPKTITTSKFDEIDADLSRMGIKSEPDFNTNTIRVSGDERKIMKIVNKYKGIEESVDEVMRLKMSTSQMKQLHKAYDKLSSDDMRRVMLSIVKRDKFLKSLKRFDKSSLQQLVDMKPNSPFSKAVQAYVDGKIKESVVNEAIKYNNDGFVTKMENEAGKVVKDITLDGEKFVLKGNKYVSKKGGKDLHKSHFGIKESVVSEMKYSNQTGIKSSVLRDNEFSNLLSPKEQKWARGNDVKIYKDRFGFTFTDGKREMVFNLNKPYSVVKPLGNASSEIKKVYQQNESVVSEKKVPKKGSADYHQHKIAVDTVKNPNKSFMGGPSTKEAEQILIKKFGYSKKEVEKLNESLLTEATRSQVGVVDKNGNIISTYVHLDGYPGYVGNILRKHYDGAKTKQLLKIAGKDGISVLDRDIKGAPGHTFDNRVKGQTLFYGRDRGDRGGNMIMKGKLDKIEDYIKSAEVKFGAEYVYLYDENSRKWFYADIGKSRTELYPL